MKACLRWTLVVMWSCFHALLLAQDADSIRYRILIDDGSTVVGALLGSDADSVRIHTTVMGRMAIPLTRIIRMERITAASDQGSAPVPPGRHEADPYFSPGVVTAVETWFHDRQVTRYFLGPSAFMLRRGEGYYRNTYLAIQSVSVGITDHVSVSAAAELLSALRLSPQVPAIQLGIKGGGRLSPILRLGGSMLYANVPESPPWRFGYRWEERKEERIGLVAFHGYATIGNERYHGTVGVGTRYSEWKGWEAAPTIQMSFAARLIPRLSLVTDNFLVGEDAVHWAVWSFGARYVAPRVTVELAVTNNSRLVSDVGFGFPFVSTCIHFGRLRS